MIIAVTGSTGALGSLVIQQLLDRVPAASIIAIARNAAKAADLKTKGVSVRLADYDDQAAIEKALQGVDRLLLISGKEVGKRLTQHQAVVDAAKKTGVKLVVYTSIAQAATSKNPLAPDHRATEEYIRTSGLPFIFLRNNWYTENYLDDARYARDSGQISAAVGKGRVASASRGDYAEAAAIVLAGKGQENTIYELTGDLAWDYHDLAKAIGSVLQRPVSFVNLQEAERTQQLLAAGLPAAVAEFVVSLDRGIAGGTLETVSPDLRKLLGRPAKSLQDVFRENLV